jgi:hypothetical protein
MSSALSVLIMVVVFIVSMLVYTRSVTWDQVISAGIVLFLLLAAGWQVRAVWRRLTWVNRRHY